jgi:molybdopterin/thiamine biosynthesis adenylyltransferase
MKKVIVRIDEKLCDDLYELLFKAYPHDEWGAFLRVNWAEVDDLLSFTVNGIEKSTEEDITNGKGVIRFHEPYLIKALRSQSKVNVGIAVIHSHPEDVRPIPSHLDNNMDSYLKEYFQTFHEDTPYLSLIFSKSKDGIISFSGRGFHRGLSFTVEKFMILGKGLKRITSMNHTSNSAPDIIKKRLERLCDSYGVKAADQLWNSTITVVGCGGTGSAVAHSLARSGIGTINLIDFDEISVHNSERVHGAFSSYFESDISVSKVDIIKNFVDLINPMIKVNIFKGSVLDNEARWMILQSDIVLNCTDTEHAKVALNEYVWRYLSVVLQVNVSIESIKSEVVGQIVQVAHLYPKGPCLYCMDMVNSQRITNELMSEDEVNIRKQAELKAQKERGEKNIYWNDKPLIPTVGALATIGGEIIANYAVGLLTGTFKPVSTFEEKNLLSSDPSIYLNIARKENCLCSLAEGCSDQAGSKKLLLN